MTRDVYGMELSSSEAAANEAFEVAVHGLASHRPTAAAALGSALASDPDHVAALALKGFANVVMAREELGVVASDVLCEARRALVARDGGTEDERILVAALGEAAGGRFHAAADRLDDGFADRPATFLPFKISHALRFMLGDRRGMLAASDRMMATWSDDTPAAGFLAGCHAFALEEHGCYRAAESIGRTAVALQPDDAWGLHAVGHVYEMRGDTASGIAWLEATRPSWSCCNNFTFHMAWHLALLHLECGDRDQVLALYDNAVRPEQTDDFRDMANAVSLLWRLERRGVDVGRRWRDLAAVASRRRTDTTLVFASLHTLVALAALGDETGVSAMIAALEQKAEGDGDQAVVAAEVGLPLARVIAGLAEEAGGSKLDRIAQDLPRLGGSHAQRDLFVLALAEAAVRRGRSAALARIRSARRRLRADDALIAAIEARGPALACTA
ncbi:MAG TPA: tetratricopeptide repeat protein [Methylomirabilota bacterium]|nr:tetratricopeptide repeat protein [Methylomirabilota bacterium]